MEAPKNGWNEWSKHVLLELERLHSSSLRLEERMQQLEKELVMLKTKVITGGAVTALIVSALVTFIKIPA